MEPEYVTYLNSPHARVRCVECHVGEGASWYVKSKLAGLYQVYSVIIPQIFQTDTDSYQGFKACQGNLRKMSLAAEIL